MFFNKVNNENECFCKLIVLGLPHPVLRSDGTSFCFCCHSFPGIKIPRGFPRIKRINAENNLNGLKTDLYSCKHDEKINS